MLIDYLPILVIGIFALAFAFGSALISNLLGPKSYTPAKGDPYESGKKPLMNARVRFSIKFYIIAVLFIIFDIEVVFMYPWAVVFKDFLPFGPFIFLEMLVFIGIFLIGYFYLWKKGAFEWE